MKTIPAIIAALAICSSTQAAPTPPMNRIVQQQAYAQLEYFFDQIAAGKESVQIDGETAFKSKDKFLPGKVALGLAHVLVNMPADDPRRAQRLADYAAVADMTVGMENDTWGIYYYLSALYRLQKAGLLEQAVGSATLDKLRARLDWRRFVSQPGFELVDLPTNYYGVAFSIARLRLLLGWEDEAGSKVLLDKMLSHYAAYSGKFGFSDETAGEGRFDRYSILLIAEICERYIETGLEVTPELKALLRKAASVALSVATADGQGFTFGRSLGPYGETAMLEILSVSAMLGVLTAEEKAYAYAWSSRATQRYMEFWYDPARKSVDMWHQGRRTDAYRGHHRVLGENLSLLHQMIFTNEQWNQAGMRDAAPRADLAAWLARTQPRFAMTPFAQGEYDRALAVYRDRNHVFSLLMVNGGHGQHANSPYYPLPFSAGVVGGVADSGAGHPQLLTKFTLADGSELLPTAWIKGIGHARRGAAHVVSYRQDELARLGKAGPEKDGRIAVRTEYALAPGAITRTDVFTPNGAQAVGQAVLEFGSFSARPAMLADGRTVRFAEGAVTEFKVDGLAGCSVAPAGADPAWRAPYGPMQSVVRCRTGAFSMDKPLTVRWTLKYR